MTVQHAFHLLLHVLQRLNHIINTPIARFFLLVHHAIRWWEVGAWTIGIVPVVYIMTEFIAPMLFKEFAWFDKNSIRKHFVARARVWSRSAFWTGYVVWIPLPWVLVEEVILLLVVWRFWYKWKKWRKDRAAEAEKEAHKFDEKPVLIPGGGNNFN